jgi:hypothetical protein
MRRPEPAADRRKRHIQYTECTAPGGWNKTPWLWQGVVVDIQYCTMGIEMILVLCRVLLSIYCTMCIEMILVLCRVLLSIYCTMCIEMIMVSCRAG